MERHIVHEDPSATDSDGAKPSKNEETKNDK